MFKKTYTKLNSEVSGDIALQHVAEISRHHRIQASPGQRDAVNYAVDRLKAYGLQAHVESHPADGKGFAWSSLMFKEWSCSDATLKLVEPAKEARFLARYQEAKISIIQRSYPTPAGGVTAEVVDVGKGEEQADYEGKQVEGCMVLCNGDVQRVHSLAVEQRGAAGLIYYGTWVREPEVPEGELDDALKYTSFWWRGGEKPGFGFVLTPRRGRWLRKLVQESLEPVKVEASVDSSIYTGMLDNAVAEIPGESDEKVVVVAHICHPQPSCNDNASGTAAAMEAARAIAGLIEAGQLAMPRRTIRFTLVPEMSGSYAHLASHEEEIPGMVAAVNMDMVGERQHLTSSSFIIERTPEATPSYVNSLMEAIFSEISGEVKNLGGSSSYALFRHTVTPFSGGSDHYVYSDPTVGVACPMIIQWPDKYWHTSFDTMDKVDPEMLRRAALLTATYAYVIADADTATALWIASETHSREKNRATERLRAMASVAVEEPGKTGEAVTRLRMQAQYASEVAAKAVQSVTRLAPGDELLEDTVEELVRNLEESIDSHLEATLDYLEAVQTASNVEPSQAEAEQALPEGAALVPVRLYRGPVSTRYWEGTLAPEVYEEYRRFGKLNEAKRSQFTLAMYWADGERSIAEIGERVRLEAGSCDVGFLVESFRYLEAMGLAELRNR